MDQNICFKCLFEFKRQKQGGQTSLHEYEPKQLLNVFAHQPMFGEADAEHAEQKVFAYQKHKTAHFRVMVQHP